MRHPVTQTILPITHSETKNS
nr:unnamed protein product [Callosobruchus chinensis]